MKFLCLYRPGTPENNDPPAEENMREMGALIGDMAKAGVLLATKGCLPSDRGAKLRITSGKFTVTEGPFPETKGLVCASACSRSRTRPRPALVGSASRPEQPHEIGPVLGADGQHAKGPGGSRGGLRHDVNKC